MIEAPKNSGGFAMSEPELLELLRRVQENEHTRNGSNRRKYVRHPYLRRDVSVRIVQPGGGACERIVAARDLSAGGVNILYPGYVYSGSTAFVILRKLSGRKESIRAQVAHCRHVSSVWHSVGLKFTESIYPRLFLIPSSRSESEEVQVGKVDLTQLKGSVLLLDDQAMDRLLFTHFLQGSSLRVTEATSLEEAEALVMRSVTGEAAGKAVTPFDLLVVDPNLGAERGEQAISSLRDKGYQGPILVMTTETSQARLTAALTAGGNGILQKPYTSERLHAAIMPWVNAGDQAIDDPIFSALAADPEQRPLVEKYVKQVRMMAADLRKCLQVRDLAKARRLCQSLKGTGVGYGYGTLTDAAGAAVVSLDASCSVVESLPELQRVEAMCARLSTAAPPVDQAHRD